jgi:hypothetical protein
LTSAITWKGIEKYDMEGDTSEINEPLAVQTVFSSISTVSVLDKFILSTF